MTNYPTSIDNDRTIIRIDDNLSELGTSVINQLRAAVFAIEKTLGVNPQGSKSSVNERISVFIGPDGNPKAEALQDIGLVTLPITNNQIASNAGINETKLALSFSTADLHTNIISLQSSVNLVQSLVAEESANLLTHISGGVLLVDNATPARHVASHIDINSIPTDSRDTYTWTGLLDINGVVRTATHVAEALLEINNELVAHETATTLLVHNASSIAVDTTNFTQLPASIENVQEALSFIDNQETLSTGVDRATLNSNGIPRTARIQNLVQDGYTINIVPSTQIHAYLAEPSQLAPYDNINNGDDVIRFLPDNTNFGFDAKFTNVKVGDILRINYGNGIEAAYPIMAVRFLSGTDWSVRVNSKNLFNVGDGYDGYARIDRPKFDQNTWGVLAAAGVVSNIPTNQLSVNSIVLGSPTGAVAVGIGFDPNMIDALHYHLHLRFYPTGNPDIFYDLPAIDVSGNQGSTPGYYNLDIIVENTNANLRASGYNYRFIAFAHKGEFGIMLADDYNGASFSIISGQVNLEGTLEEGPYTLNVIGDVTDHHDALGLGMARSGFATPVMSRAGHSIPYPNSISAANYSTLVITPVRGRNVMINGNRRDLLAKPRFVEADGYWNAFITNITPDVPHNTVLVTYSIPLNLESEGLSVGKTIVVQPANVTDTSINHYGRFIIDSVSFSCTGAGQTNITVLNSSHGTANPSQTTLPLQSNVLIYFSDDSVMFNMGNMIGSEFADPTAYFHYHEVFVNDIGKSVSVERARIAHVDGGPVVGSGNLGNLPWRIRRVSPKLIGERIGLTDFRYFVKLRVGNYDSSIGEFDLYLVDLNGDISGPVAKGKKNHPVRVYDKSCINFIDIEFRELAGVVTPITTGNIAIELFPTLKNNDEYFAVAGVSHDGVSFQSITDLRDFGTLSEENFSDSAIKFIESGSRYLHANGIVRGLNFISRDNTRLLFKGGLALVNGAFVPIDSTNVGIPTVNGEYFICITETGQLIAVHKHDNNDASFVESLTFREIVDYRKDLAIIAKAQVASGTITVTDARRYVVNQDLSIFSWSYSDADLVNNYDGGNQRNSSFITAQALMNWVNEYNIKEVQVNDVIINSGLVLNFTSPVILKGGSYHISNGLSFTCGNWIIDDADIEYTPTSFSATANDVFCLDSNAGCITIDGLGLNDIISDFGIRNSRFASSAQQRPPFVAIYSAVGDTNNEFYNGRFENNTFTDSGIDRALCYAFINSNAPINSANSPYFADMLISGTKINRRQGILISGRATPNDSESGYLAMSKVLIENFIIKENEFGLIGFNVDNRISTTEAGRFIIENNRAELIYSHFTATMNPTDFTFAESPNYSSGNSVSCTVRDNVCNFMKIEASSGSNELKTIITNNIIQRRDSYLYQLFVSNAAYAAWALVVQSQGLYQTSVIISNNNIDGKTSGYRHSIFTSGVGATITGNIINNIGSGGWGIYNVGTSLIEHSTIVGNALNKADGVLIAGYIVTSATAAIYGNTLSHANLASWSGDVDGYGDLSNSNFNGIYGAGATFAAWNVNQVVRTVPNLASSIPLYHISPVSGTVINIEENSERLLHGLPASNQFLNKGLQKVSFKEHQGWHWMWNGGSLANNDGTVGLIIPLSSVLPDRAYLLSLSVTLYFSCNWEVYGNGGASPTTFPEISLELNGNMVDSKNPFASNPDWTTGFGSVNLIYQSEALITGQRPEAPLIKEMVIKMKQGINAGNVAFGGWIGPTGSGNQSLRIGQPWITYMY